MPDDSTENPPPGPTAQPETPAAATPAEGASPTRPDRPKESWEPQVRALRKPEFASRLTKTSDLPTEVPTERKKSKLGEHRAAAIQWEKDPDPGEPDPTEIDPDNPDATEKSSFGTLSRGQKITLAGLSLVVVTLAAVWFAKSLLVGDGSSRALKAAMASQAAQEAAAAAAATLTPAEYDQATGTMRQFLEALTLEDLRPVLRDPDRVWPLVVAHHQEKPWKPFVVRKLPSRSEIQLNRDLLAGVVEVDDFQRIVLAMQRTPDGPKIDWESYTGQGEMTWEEFLARRPTTPVLMRVSLQPDDYYNRDFPDSGTHACFRLSSRGETHLLYGYAPRGQPVHTQLVSRTRINPRTLPTLRLRFLPNSKSQDQVEITELVADGWLVSESSRLPPSQPQDSPPR